MRMRGVISVVGVSLLVAGLGACARSGGGAAAPARAPIAAPPANSKLAKVQEGMSTREVENLLGAPTDENAYVTGKAFIPWHFGPDHTRRAYYYKGLGRVVFKQAGAFSGDYRVMRVEYDPSEPGHRR
jgi:hypothetical protein